MAGDLAQDDTLIDVDCRLYTSQEPFSRAAAIWPIGDGLWRNTRDRYARMKRHRVPALRRRVSTGSNPQRPAWKLPKQPDDASKCLCGFRNAFDPSHPQSP